MKAQLKYIVYRDANGMEIIEAFGTAIIHADYVAKHGIPIEWLISAGYATADLECYGASTSLGLSSRPKQDTAMLRDEDDE